ncbi:MAG TPA: hypothetical protein DCP31_22410, partial [Cyanobacteria bacterium UBA8543]|nr:hypothetical protein [Cyanobacteria bacterium UBA8543]
QRQESTASRQPSANTQRQESTSIAGAVQSQKGIYQQLSLDTTIPIGSTAIKLVKAEPSVLQLQIHSKTWLLLGEIKPDAQQKLAETGNLRPVEVLWWSGETLTPELLEALKPKVAIASSNTVDLETAQQLRNAKIPLYWTGRDGAIQWTPNGGFETTLEAISNDAPLL